MKSTKKNYYWNYIIIAVIIAIPVIFIAPQFYFSNSRSPAETNWSNVLKIKVLAINIHNSKLKDMSIKKPNAPYSNRVRQEEKTVCMVTSS
jgi:hypothetical protein